MTDRERDMRLIERAEYAASIEEGGAAQYREHATACRDDVSRARLTRRADQRDLNARRAREIAQQARDRLQVIDRPETPAFITALRRWKESTR